MSLAGAEQHGGRSYIDCLRGWSKFYAAGDAICASRVVARCVAITKELRPSFVAATYFVDRSRRRSLSPHMMISLSLEVWRCVSWMYFDEIRR